MILRFACPGCGNRDFTARFTADADTDLDALMSMNVTCPRCLKMSYFSKPLRDFLTPGELDMAKNDKTPKPKAAPKAAPDSGSPEPTTADPLDFILSRLCGNVMLMTQTWAAVKVVTHVDVNNSGLTNKAAQFLSGLFEIGGLLKKKQPAPGDDRATRVLNEVLGLHQDLCDAIDVAVAVDGIGDIKAINDKLGAYLGKELGTIPPSGLAGYNAVEPAPPDPVRVGVED